MQNPSVWPKADFPLDATEVARLQQWLQPTFIEQLTDARLPLQLAAELPRLYLPLAAWLNRQRPGDGPLLVGVNGSQGSGKSTLCTLLKWILEAAFDCHTGIISIDDLYLPKSVRRQLAETVHPLLATRGVPGTHDVKLGIKLLAQLQQTGAGRKIALPRFSKADDDRLPPRDWGQITTPVEVVLFEGWCVGATPQTEAQLQKPINRLEAEEDADGTWRRYVNEQLRGPYHKLFDRLDLLLMLQIPDWEMVYHWRRRQEQQLAAKDNGNGIMSETELRRFIMHYERLTRHQSATLPQVADLTLKLNQQQRVTAVRLR